MSNQYEDNDKEQVDSEDSRSEKIARKSGEQAAKKVINAQQPGTAGAKAGATNVAADAAVEGSKTASTAGGARTAAAGGANAAAGGARTAAASGARTAAASGAANAAAGGARTAAAAGGVTAAGAAGGAQAGAATAAANAAASGTSTAAAAGGVASGAAKGAVAGAGIVTVGQSAAEMMRGLSKGDGVEAGSAAVRGGATLAAMAALTPALGAVVGAVLNTRAGRKVSKAVVWLFFGLLMTILLIIMLVIFAMSSVITNTTIGYDQRASCVAPRGGGVPVSNPQQLEVARTIVDVAIERGLGTDGAVLAVMTSLAESDLRNGLIDPLQPDDTPEPFRTIGVFQQMPFYWANEFWPDGVSENDPEFTDPQYLEPAKEAILDPEYAANSFFDKLTTHPSLKDNQWKELPPWEVAQTIQQSIFADGSNYASRHNTAMSTVATIMANNGQSYTQYQTVDNEGLPFSDEYEEVYANSTLIWDFCGDGTSYVGAAGFVLPDDNDGVFEDGPTIYPNTEEAVARALSYVGNPPCDDGRCYRKCDNLAGRAWGYAWSGYDSAKVHWHTALRDGVAVLADRNPPIGALLYWDTGPYGHVATYVGNGYVVSNMNNGENGANVYLVPASYFERYWGSPYLGWSDPIFRGESAGYSLDQVDGPFSFR